MSFFKNRMDVAARAITGQVAAKIGAGGVRRGQADRVLSVASSFYMEAFKQQMTRAADDARKAKAAPRNTKPATTKENAERLTHLLALCQMDQAVAEACEAAQSTVRTNAQRLARLMAR